MVPVLAHIVIHIWCAEPGRSTLAATLTACHKRGGAVFASKADLFAHLPYFCASTNFPLESTHLACMTMLAHNLIHKTCAE